MKMTCFIRYQIDPFQRDAFKQYAENFIMAQTKRIILREKRTFLEIVDGTFGLPPQTNDRGPSDESSKFADLSSIV